MYKVLIVDDSAFVRVSFSNLINSHKDFEVIGVARNGLEALEKSMVLKPDVITMDIEMNVMNGLDALREIVIKNPIPVVIVSEFTQKGAKMTLDALRLGAVECVLKTDVLHAAINKQNNEWFFDKLEAAAKFKYKNLSFNKETYNEKKFSKINKNINLLVIGSSTGGPNALQKIIPKLPENINFPILVTQHMPKGFTGIMAKRFNGMSALTVKELENDEVLNSGVVYIAPSGYQTVIIEENGMNIFKVEENKGVKEIYSPRIDKTLESCAQIYKDSMVVVILTGMGKDGTMGCKKVKEEGGYVITQNESSCIVYGMPKAVFEAGFSDEQIDINEIHKRITSI